MILDTLTPAIKTPTGQTLLNGATPAYYPSFEPSDPRPVQHRGAYFSGFAYIQLPPAPSTLGAPLMFSNILSLSIWIRTQLIGDQVLFHKVLNCDNIVTLSLALTGTNIVALHASGYLQNSLQTINVIGPIIAFDQWIFVGCSLEYQATTGQTTSKIYYNALQVASSAQVFSLMDLFLAEAQVIGADISGGSGFKGFLWQFTLYPYVRNFASDIVNTNCPAGLNYCLSSTPISQTYTGENCSPNCSNGCVRTSDCSLCADALCDVCADMETLTCSQCIPNAAAVPTCACNQGYFFNILTRSCDLCAPTCHTCSKVPSNCTEECFDNAVLDLQGHCSCSPSFYPNSLLALCSACSSTCLTCSSEHVCTSCMPKAELKRSTCVCSNGYYGAANNCKTCAWGCQLCSGEMCEHCLSGYFNLDGTCSLHCPPNFSEDQNNWICLSLPLPYAGVSVNVQVDETNCVTLNFSQPVQPQLTLEALSLLLNDIDAHNYPISANMYMWGFQPNQTYNISVALQQSYLPADNELTIVFLHPEEFTDAYGTRLLNFSLSLALHSQGSANTTTTLSPETKKSAVAAVASSAAAGVALGVVTSNLATLFVMINNVQLLTYLPLSTIPLPTQLKSQLIGVNWQSLLANPVTGYLSDLVEVNTSTPDFARNYGFTTSSFLSNTGTIFCTAVVNLGVFVALWVLSKVYRDNEHIRKWLEGYHWKYAGMHWILCYLDLSIAAYLQVLRVSTIQLSFATAKAGLISSLGCLVALANSIFPLGLLYMCIRHRTHINSRTFDWIRPWSFLYTELKNNKGWLSSAYFAVSLFRKLIYALTLVYLHDYPFTQSLLCYLHSMLVTANQTIMYLLIYRPFSSKLEAITISVSEIAVGILFSLVIAFNFDLSSSTSELILTLTSACVYIATCFPTLTGLIRLYTQVRGLLTRSIKTKSLITPVTAQIRTDVTAVPTVLSPAKLNRSA